MNQKQKGDQESIEEDPMQEDPQDSSEHQQESEEDLQEQNMESKAEGEAGEETEMLEEAQAPIDSMSVSYTHLTLPTILLV